MNPSTGEPQIIVPRNSDGPLLSLVTPAFNEDRNLPVLHERISKIAADAGIEWEWIVVDDHSTDDTFGALQRLAQQDARVRGFRLARNFGAHLAATCGLQQSRGQCAVILAADLQDPPELIPELLERWRQGHHVVWAVRGSRADQSPVDRFGSRLYYALMRHFVGMKEMPPTGADFFLVDRRVLEVLRQFNETSISVPALIMGMGFHQSQLTYDKQARLHGRSGWNFSKKLKLIIDSVVLFSYRPLRLMSYLGVLVGLLGFLYSCLVIGNALFGSPVSGWSSLMVVVLLLGGIQMIMLGTLGEYLWRTLENARNRPRYWLEATTAESVLPVKPAPRADVPDGGGEPTACTRIMMSSQRGGAG